MTKEMFLIDLKEYTEEAVEDLRLPVRMQKGDESQPDDRAPIVYLMRLPNKDATSATRFAPYILHQLITARDIIQDGQRAPSSSCVVRTVFCVYDPDETTGPMALLELMEKFRINLLTKPVIKSQFMLNLKEGVDYIIYPEIGDPPMATAPYYVGEMVTQWHLPQVQREDGTNIWVRNQNLPSQRMP